MRQKLSPIHRMNLIFLIKKKNMQIKEANLIEQLKIPNLKLDKMG